MHKKRPTTEVVSFGETVDSTFQLFEMLIVNTHNELLVDGLNLPFGLTVNVFQHDPFVQPNQHVNDTT